MFALILAIAAVGQCNCTKTQPVVKATPVITIRVVIVHEHRNYKTESTITEKLKPKQKYKSSHLNPPWMDPWDARWVYDTTGDDLSVIIPAGD